MPVTTTYPGLYIQELPNNSHTITASPTSVTVFVGYTHPFKTDPTRWGVATEIFTFTDYQKSFGGLYTSGVIESHVAYAVNQFFLNGGADAFVVALPPNYYDTSGNNQGAVIPPTLTVGPVTFTGLEPIDLTPMTITINNVKTTFQTNDTADITISYGPRGETYRKVNLNSSDPNYIGTIIGTAPGNGSSQLVTVAPSSNQGFVAIGQAALAYSPAPDPSWGTFNTIDFAQLFQADSSLDKLPVFNLLLVPGVADNGIWSEALSFCERKLAFVIMDPPAQDSADGAGSANLPLIGDDVDLLVPKSPNGALYFPYIRSLDPITSNELQLPPSGSVAGIYSTIDASRGVWKAPAGLETVLQNTPGVVPTGDMTDNRQGTLNPKGVNCLRDFTGIGAPVVFGARTLITANPAFEQWRYIPVRRMALFIEQTLKANLTWVVFEPNDATLWVSIRNSIESFMLTLFHQGAFPGTTPSTSFQVLCDNSTTTQDDIDNGIVNIVVMFAPLKPAEFVVIQIAQMAGQTQS